MDDNQYLTNDAGDIWARASPDGPVEIDPSEAFGWAAQSVRAASEDRRTIAEVEALPDFTLELTDGERWVPGPRPPRSAELAHGRAAPAALTSVRGTLAYYDRLTDALGAVVQEAITRPDRCPFTVYDYVNGREITVSYTPPPIVPGGNGRVYFVTDGTAMKIGFTTTTVAARVRDLQTGNPRPIKGVLTLHDVGVPVEWELHSAFGEHRLSGEWFDLEGLRGEARRAGGWELLILEVLGPGEWEVQVEAST